MNLNNIIIRPIVTEKTTTMVQAATYAFEVHKNANKRSVAEALKKMFDVTIASVHMLTRKGKEKRVGRRMKSKQLPDRKIAYITLSKGTIDLFPQG